MAYKFYNKAAAGQSFITASGTSYTVDANGLLSIPNAVNTDIINALNAGFVSLGLTGAVSNYSATTDPTVSSDNTLDYAAGSRWLNLTTGVEWYCQGALTGAAIWVPELNDGMLIGRLLGANFNVTTDQAIPMFGLSALNKFRVTRITTKNASISLTTAAGGIYTAASKGGTAIVASSQAYTSLSASTLVLDDTIATTPGITIWAAGTPLFLALTTAQGSAATADIYVFGDIYA